MPALRRLAARAFAGRRLRPRARTAWVLALVVAAFAVRALHAVDLAPSLEGQEQPGARMMQRYDEGAATILGGGGLLFVARPEPGDTALLSRPPGYSLFLAALYRTVGRGFFLVQLVQNLLNAAGVGLLVLLADRLFGGRAAIASGALAALAPHLAYYSNLISPDVVCALPVLGGLLLVAPAARGRRVSLTRALAAGALFGAAVWLRPNLLLLGMAVALALVVAARRRRWRTAIAVAVGSLLAVAPITIRNYVLYGEVVPVSINFGIVLWEGIGESSGNAWGTQTDDIDVAADEARLYGEPRYGDWWASPDGIRRDRARVRRSLAVIAQHPAWFAGVALRRMAQMVSYGGGVTPAVLPPGEVDEGRLDALVEPGRGRNAQRLFGDLARLRPVLSAQECLAPGRALGRLRPAVRLLQRAFTVLARPLVLTGVLLVAAAAPRRAAYLFAVPLYQLAFQSIVHLEFRYTLPMQHLLFVAAGAAVAALAAAVARAGSRTMGG